MLLWSCIAPCGMDVPTIDVVFCGPLSALSGLLTKNNVFGNRAKPIPCTVYVACTMVEC